MRKKPIIWNDSHFLGAFYWTIMNLCDDTRRRDNSICLICRTLRLEKIDSLMFWRMNERDFPFVSFLVYLVMKLLVRYLVSLSSRVESFLKFRMKYGRRGSFSWYTFICETSHFSFTARNFGGWAGKQVFLWNILYCFSTSGNSCKRKLSFYSFSQFQWI